MNRSLPEHTFWRRLAWVNVIGYASIWVMLLCVVLFVQPVLKDLAERAAVRDPSVNRIPGIDLVYASGLTLVMTGFLAVPGVWLFWIVSRSRDPLRSSVVGFGFNLVIGLLLLTALFGTMIYYVILLPQGLSRRPS